MSDLGCAGLTEADLHELFSRHCECRPLDLNRAEGDHAYLHDCDLSICELVQTVQHSIDQEERDVATRAAVQRLAQDRRMGYGNRHAVIQEDK